MLSAMTGRGNERSSSTRSGRVSDVESMEQTVTIATATLATMSLATSRSSARRAIGQSTSLDGRAESVGGYPSDCLLAGAPLAEGTSNEMESSARSSLIRFSNFAVKGSARTATPSSTAATATAIARSASTKLAKRGCQAARRAVAYYVRWTNGWRERMGAGAGPRRSIAENPCPRYLAHLWRQKAIAARHAFERWFTRTYEKWRCIHEHEGAWNSATGNGYNGGLQMTPWFQATYGAEFLRRFGPAHLWPIWAQLVAAERAYATTGFRQWPNTARACGLL